MVNQKKKFPENFWKSGVFFIWLIIYLYRKDLNMYKNFSLTDEERQQILEQHKSHGYKKPLSEQSTWNKYNRITSPTGQDFYEPNPDYDPDYKEPEEVVKFKPLYERVYFNNGGNISIQASRTAYSNPRNDEGPYTHMEMGYPSKDTVLPKNVLRYVEQSSLEGTNDPYDSVYPYVPVSVIKELVQANGGVKSGELPPMADEPIEDEPMDDYESSVENDDYNERQERNYGVED